MKKHRGTCPRCGKTTVGIKGVSWSGSTAPRSRGNGKGAQSEKKGNIKCLSCQSTIGVQMTD